LSILIFGQGSVDDDLTRERWMINLNSLE